MWQGLRTCVSPAGGGLNDPKVLSQWEEQEEEEDEGVCL